MKRRINVNNDIKYADSRFAKTYLIVLSISIILIGLLIAVFSDALTSFYGQLILIFFLLFSLYLVMTALFAKDKTIILLAQRTGNNEILIPIFLVTAYLYKFISKRNK